MSCHDLPARAVTSPDGYPLAAEHPPLECRLMTGLRVLGLMFAVAVILVGLWIGPTPRNFTTSDARVPGTFTTACGSPFAPADSSGQCLAELNSRRTSPSPPSRSAASHLSCSRSRHETGRPATAHARHLLTPRRDKEHTGPGRAGEPYMNVAASV